MFEGDWSFPRALLDARSVEDVDAYIAGGEDPSDIDRCLATPTFLGHPATPVLKAWKERRAGLDKERALRAAELQATAAVDAARAAKASAVCAAIAIGVSLIAIGISVWQPIKPPEPQSQSAVAAPTPAAPTAGTSPPTTRAAASRPSLPQSR